MGKLMPAIGSAVFFVLAPGTVAGLVPWWLSDGFALHAPCVADGRAWLTAVPAVAIAAP